MGSVMLTASTQLLAGNTASSPAGLPASAQPSAVEGPSVDDLEPPLSLRDEELGEGRHSRTLPPTVLSPTASPPPSPPLDITTACGNAHVKAAGGGTDTSTSLTASSSAASASAPAAASAGASASVPPGRIVNYAEAKGRAALQEDNPLEVDDPAAERVHAWLCNQLHAGYHDLASLLAKLDALDHDYSPHQAEPRRLCVSLCGSQRAMLQTRAHMAKARSKLRGSTEVAYELAADYHG